MAHCEHTIRGWKHKYLSTAFDICIWSDNSYEANTAFLSLETSNHWESKEDQPNEKEEK